MSNDNAYLGSATRRRLLTATPGSLLWALAGGLGTASHIATAQPLQAGAVPEVDRLAVRVVTDSYHHAFEASRTVGDVQLQRVGNALKPNAQPRTLLNEWGLSLHLQSSRG
ncbi:MAG TPA: MBL fold metallo-hydrolase, partial [Rubrivivax sp.]|nr:MBL fold metallo-hydrolase [Rubrivivax sp.]